MIEVKALKSAQNRAPSAEETYRNTQEELAPSRWPAALAAIVLAIAGYLRSLYSVQAETVAEPGEDDRAAASAEAGDETPESEGDPDETGSLAEKDPPDYDQELGSGAASGPVPGLADFLGIDSPPINYEQLPLPPFVRGSIEFGLGRVSNDNGYMASNASWTIGGQVAPSDFRFGTIEGGGSQLPVVVAPFNPVIVAPEPPNPPEEPDPVGPQDPPPRNRAPRLAGTVQLGNIGGCQTLLLTMAGLLAGASDADADPLTIRDLQVSSGMIELAEGGWQYRPTAGYYGHVFVTYGVTDGLATVSQLAVLRVVEFLEIDGTAGDDVLTGTDCADLIRGGEGNDSIDARGGKDTVYGGAGDDVIYGGAGNDTLYGGAGNDVIYGGAGNDRLYGNDGDDRLHGEDGDDELSGGGGNDYISGGAGNDTIDGSSGDDTLHGDAGDDHIVGGDGNDVIFGGDGDDIIEAGDGNNDVDGGTGNNIISTGSGRNRIVTADGDNTVLGGGGTDMVQLGAGRDVVRLGGGDDTVAAGAGSDRLFGEDGDDTLFGQAGDDRLDGGDGNDTLVGGTGDDTLLGRDGADILDAGDGDDKVDGGEGDDTVLAGDGDDEIHGGDGDDVIRAQEGDDVVSGGEGDDVILGGNGDDVLDGGEGDDVVQGEAGDDCLIGGEGNDTLIGAAGDDRLRGGEGDDTLDGGAGSDTVTAGSGDDLVIASADGQNDCLDGGAGYDTLDLSETNCGVSVDLTESKAVGIEIGEDTVLDFEALIGGKGNDHFVVGSAAATLTGGDGDDTFAFDIPAPADNDLIHQILDLQEGDRIVVKQYQIHSDAMAGGMEIDPFNETYTDDGGEGHRPFRFRIEKIDDEERTYVDVFVAQQDDKDFSIEIYGAHKLYYC